MPPEDGAVLPQAGGSGINDDLNSVSASWEFPKHPQFPLILSIHTYVDADLPQIYVISFVPTIRGRGDIVLLDKE